MAKHLKQVTMPISNYLSKRFGHALRGKKSMDNSLPDHLIWAKFRGEALFINRFFNYFEQKNISDVSSQLFFLQQFKFNPDVLALLSSNTGLITIFKNQVSTAYLENTSEVEQHYIAYCCLLWDIHQQKDNNLLDTATLTLFGHFSATIFPAHSKRTDIKKLKQDIRKHLAQQWNLRTEINESFQENEQGITFKLLAKASGKAPCLLITLAGKRLKPTRLKAYQTVLKTLENGNITDFSLSK